MKKFEDIWKKANEEADLKYDPKGVLARSLFLYAALKERIEPFLEKQQPEIPEFVAAAIEAKNHIYGDFRRTANITHYSEDVRHWYYAKPYHAELFYRAILDDYTVAKEKRFYLKNKLTGSYLYRSEKDDLSHQTYCKDYKGKPLDYCVFTHQEIDSMETGSYEQIKAEEEE